MTEALPLLDVRDLTVEFQTRRGIVRAVQHVDVTVAKGETLAIVGESGSGKSVTSYAVMRILDRAGHIAEGSVYFTGLDIRDASEDEMVAAFDYCLYGKGGAAPSIDSRMSRSSGSSRPDASRS